MPTYFKKLRMRNRNCFKALMKNGKYEDKHSQSDSSRKLKNLEVSGLNNLHRGIFNFCSKRSIASTYSTEWLENSPAYKKLLYNFARELTSEAAAMEAKVQNNEITENFSIELESNFDKLSFVFATNFSFCLNFNYILISLWEISFYRFRATSWMKNKFQK